MHSRSNQSIEDFCDRYGIGRTTVYGEIRSGRLDNEPAIERNTREREVDPNLQEFARRDFGNASQQRILEAIYSVSADLLNAEDPQWVKKSNPASSGPTTPKGAEEAEGPVRMINPADVLFDLREMAAKHRNKSAGPAGFYGVSLQGAIGMLFSVDEEQEIDLSHEKWQGEKPDDDMGDNDAGKDPRASIQTNVLREIGLQQRVGRDLR